MQPMGISVKGRMAMFKRRKSDSSGDIMPPSDPTPAPDPETAPPRTLARPSAGNSGAGPTASPLPRLASPGFPSPRSSLPPLSPGRLPVPDAGEGRKLVVGRDIALAGQITACERLIVEGRVEATLADCRSIEITEPGLFKGSAEIDTADIAGRFEGDLTVRGRLIVRATGRIEGQIRYGQIEIEAGGEIAGDAHPIRARREAKDSAAATSGETLTPSQTDGASAA
jgi:cytoskeletal protein CcmA (bactofilin family)